MSDGQQLNGSRPVYRNNVSFKVAGQRCACCCVALEVHLSRVLCMTDGWWWCWWWQWWWGHTLVLVKYVAVACKLSSAFLKLPNASAKAVHFAVVLMAACTHCSPRARKSTMASPSLHWLFAVRPSTFSVVSIFALMRPATPKTFVSTMPLKPSSVTAAASMPCASETSPSMFKIKRIWTEGKTFFFSLKAWGVPAEALDRCFGATGEAKVSFAEEVEAALPFLLCLCLKPFLTFLPALPDLCLPLLRCADPDEEEEEEPSPAKLLACGLQMSAQSTESSELPPKSSFPFLLPWTTNRSPAPSAKTLAFFELTDILLFKAFQVSCTCPSLQAWSLRSTSKVLFTFVDSAAVRLMLPGGVPCFASRMMPRSFLPRNV